MPFLLLYNFTFHNVSINTPSIRNLSNFFFIFTFHNVSINTIYKVMLLIFFYFFTFHNVSINTARNGAAADQWRALHSTMFLLIPFHWLWSPTIASFFTFHNVSINTAVELSFNRHYLYFTFHNVSINTSSWLNFALWYITLHSTMFLLIRVKITSRFGYCVLYIPQCFY